jgi:microcystin synthetase protein McyG
MSEECGRSREADVDLFDESGHLTASVHGLVLTRTPRAAIVDVEKRHADWRYEIEWRRRPRLAFDRSPAPGEVANRATVFNKAGPRASTGFEELLPELESLSTTYVLRAMQDLGLDWRIGASLDRSSIGRELGIARRHRPLLERLLGTLIEYSLLRSDGSALEIVGAPDLDDPQLRWADLRDRFPAFDAELSLLGRCAPRLAAVLRGDQDPVDLLFPDGSLEPLEKMYGHSPQFAGDNDLLGHVVAEAARVWQEEPNREVRILEVGAGTGGTTSSVLPLLPRERIAYTFTDVSSRFLTEAKDRYAEYPSVRYATLDIERSPSKQGFEGQRFEIVLAANVLHATSDLRRTLENVRELLAPGGMLVLFEVTRPQLWIDLTFGLTEGWWRFTDHDLRPDHPLLRRDQWIEVLDEVGLDEVQSVVTTGESQTTPPVQSLLLARSTEGAADAVSSRPGSWIVFADREGLGDFLRDELQRLDQRVISVSRGEAYRAVDTDHFTIDPHSRGDVRRLLGEASAIGPPLRGVVHLWSLDVPEADALKRADLSACGPGGLVSMLHVAQELVSANTPARLWVITHGAEPVTPTADSAVAQAPAWGLGRGIALEHPEQWGGLVDLDPAPLDNASRSAAAAQLCAELGMPDAEDQVAYRGGQRFAARLVRSRHTGLTGSRPPLKKDASYLITGGLGSLGLMVARWMAERGAGHLVLVGRNGLPERATWDQFDPVSPEGVRIGAVREIEALGARVSPVATDLGEPEQVEALFGLLEAPEPLRGVVHAAGVADPCSIQEMTPERLAATLRPKVLGAWTLHELTREVDLDFFVLYSSTTALLGASRLAHYAAANHFLDALAHHRRAMGLPGLSINWGTWEALGGLPESEREEVSRHGLQPMASSEALALLGEVLGTPIPEIAVAAVDWNVLRPAYEAKRTRPLLSELGSSEEETQTASDDGLGSILDDLERASKDDRLDILESWISGEVARALGLERDRTLDVRRGFFEMGMDSLTSVDLKRRLEGGISQSLPATLTFNHPTVEALATFLAERLWADEVHGGVAGDASNRSANAADLGEPAEQETGDLSEDELARQLAARLRGLE